MRQRSRSPVDRRHTDEGDSYGYRGRRDYNSEGAGYRRGGSFRGRGRGGSRGGFRGGRGRGGSRGGFRGPQSSAYTSYSTPEEAAAEYRNKTERNYDNSIFVGNIPYDVGPSDVQAIFGDDFKVKRADIVTNRGRSRGMATVEFSSKEEVKAAIERFDHYEYRGRQIFVRQDYPPPEEKKAAFSEYNQDRPRKVQPPRERDAVSSPVTGTGTEIFVGNLPFSVSWYSLKDLMKTVGEVERADVRLDGRGKSMGFGTVIFKRKEDADLALERFNGYEIEGRVLNTRPGRNSRPTGPRKPAVSGNGAPSDTIFVENLPFVTTVEDLYELFETIGNVLKGELIMAGNGRATGNAVVQFESRELADLAIANLGNYNYGGRDLKITYLSAPLQPSTQETSQASQSLTSDAMEDTQPTLGDVALEEPEVEAVEVPEPEAMEVPEPEAPEAPEAQEAQEAPEAPEQDIAETEAPEVQEPSE